MIQNLHIHMYLSSNGIVNSVQEVFQTQKVPNQGAKDSEFRNDSKIVAFK